MKLALFFLSVFVQQSIDRGALVGEYPALSWEGLCGRSGPRCLVTSHGAVGDGIADDTLAIRTAIKACSALVRSVGGHTVGGASVVLPGAPRGAKGRVYLSGAINLTSGVDLVIEDGATLLGSTNPDAYPIVPHLPGYPQCRDSNYPDGHGYARHQALVSGWNLTGSSVCGGGKIDGQGLVKVRQRVHLLHDDPLIDCWVSICVARVRVREL